MLLSQKQLQHSIARAPAGPRLRGAIVVMAEPPSNPRVSSGRSFTDDGKAVPPSSSNPQPQQSQQPGQPLYADAAQGKKKQDNMSMEMKKRLRDEYVGLGGTPNKAMGNNYFLWIIVVISSLAVASKLSGAL